MEIAVLIENEKEYTGDYVRDYCIPWGSDSNGLKAAYHQIEKYKDNKIDIIYFGNEFCEYRIPSVHQLKGVINLCKKKNKMCVLVTPVVTDYGIEKISLLIDYLNDNKNAIDIVVNDVGVLELLRKKAYTGAIIAGRILDKTSHDCRASKREFDDYYGQDGKKFARTPGVISSFARMIFEWYSVKRYEFDLPEIGLDLPDTGNYSLYWPYSYLTTGRVCMMRSLDLMGKEKFLVGDGGCSMKCKQYRVEKRKPINGYSLVKNEKKSEMFLFQKGNTIFYINKEEIMSNDKFDRLIIQL